MALFLFSVEKCCNVFFNVIIYRHKKKGDVNMNYLTVNELAKKLNISREMVYRLINDNKDFPYFIVGKSKRFDFAEVETWLKKNKEAR